jgi:hypothetical protein
VLFLLDVRLERSYCLEMTNANARSVKVTVKAIKDESVEKHGGKYVGVVTLGGSTVGCGDASDSKLAARRAGWRAAEEMGLVSL